MPARSSSGSTQSLPGNARWRDAVLDFLGAGGAPGRPVDRVLATILFTDIISSTELADRVGDDAWRALLDQHDRIAQTAIEHFGGRLIKTTGDGMLASFEGPGRGIGCARTVAHALRPLDLRIRAGVHTGEVELRGDDVAGMAVVIARRICDLAGADEILASRTVKDLVTGRGSSSPTAEAIPSRACPTSGTSSPPPEPCSRRS